MDRGAWRATGHEVAHDWVTKHTNKNKVIFWLGDENTVTEGSQEPHHVFPLGAIVSSRSNSLAFINSTLEYNNKHNNKHYGDIIKSTANSNNKLCKINLKISPFWHLTKSWGNSEFDELNSLCVCVCMYVLGLISFSPMFIISIVCIFLPCMHRNDISSFCIQSYYNRSFFNFIF